MTTLQQRVAITVTSQASGESQPISAQAFWGDSAIDLANGTRKQALYVSVSQGTYMKNIFPQFALILKGS